METNGKQILLAEDDRFLRRACEMSLRQLGYTVLLAKDGEEALAVIQNRATRPRFCSISSCPRSQASMFCES